MRLGIGEELLRMIELIHTNKDIPREVIFRALEEALAAGIRKRLGGERHSLLSAMMSRAFENQWRDGDVAGHCEWIAALLEQYYDPMYEYQLRQRRGRALFRGPRQAVNDWARESG